MGTCVITRDKGICVCCVAKGRTVPGLWTGMVCLERNWNLLVTVNTEDRCHKLFCVMTTLDVVWLKWLLKQIEHWSTGFSLTQNMVQILSRLINIFLYSVMLCGNWFFKRWDQIHGAYVSSCRIEKIHCRSMKMLLYRRYSKLQRYLKMKVFLLYAFCRINKKCIACFRSSSRGWVRKYPECVVLKWPVEQYNFFYIINLIFGALSALGRKFLCALINKN